MTEKYLTVTALTRYIKRKFELDKHLNTVWLQAEISNFNHHGRGHMYFTLKDDQARISAVMFAGYNRSLRFEPENGMHVIVKGEVNVYEPMGQYQLYVHDMIPDGVGALHIAFEQLKEKLSHEGLFDESKKQPILEYPAHIGVITSPTGAAIQDVLSTIKRRYPLTKVSVFPSLVQGKLAKDDLVRKINQANQDQSIDTIILARGGGSIEDLWPFNEEAVARAISASEIPIISGIGHETDITIADFVADLRAPTPTAAAELAVPLKREITEKNNEYKRRLNRQINLLIDQTKDQLQRIRTSYAFNYPRQLVSQKEQELDRILDNLQRNIERQLQTKKHTFQQLNAQLKHKSPKEKLKGIQEKQSYLTKVLHTSFKKNLEKKVTQYDKQLDKLQLLSPLNTMRRGFSIGYTESGQVIKSVQKAEIGNRIKLQLIDGSLNCQVTGIEEDHDDERNANI